MLVSQLRTLLTNSGVTPGTVKITSLLRQLVTLYGGTPTKWSVVGLLREAITASGGTPLYYDVVRLLRQLISARGGTPTKLSIAELGAQLVATAGPTAAPTNTAIPVISGTPTEGQTLSASNGTWTGSPTYSYQWKRDGAAISGSINSSRILTSADVGAVMTCTVTATNAGGSASATSAGTTAVASAAPSPPVNTVAPVASGTGTVGSTLSTTDGTWSGSPTSFTYQWRRNGVNISGATASTYTLVTADGGTDITCRVAATNAGGSTPAVSNAVTIAAAPPVNTSPPVISGNPYSGQVLSLGGGVWFGTGISYTNQWNLDGVAISGQTGGTYTVQAGDVGHVVTCTVTATNTSGSTSSTSNSLTIVAGVLVPTTSWRLQVTDTYDSSGADATFKTAMLAQHTAKNLPTPTTQTVTAGTTRHLSFKTAAIAAPGGFFLFRPSYASDVNQTLAVLESFDSVDGSPGSGTWTANAYTVRGFSEGAGLGKGSDRCQIAQLAAGAARWVRLALTNTSGSMSAGSEFAFGQHQASGQPPADLWVSVGMSISRANYTSTKHRSLVRSLVPAADPILLDIHRSGANALNMKSEMIDPITTDPQFFGIFNVLFDGGPNDEAFSGIRPWTGKQSDIDTGTRFTANLTELQTKFGAAHVYASNISYMNSLTGNTADQPYTNNHATPSNGTLPYNTNYVNPTIKSLSPVSWSAKYDAPLLDDYVGQGLYKWNESGLNDSLHGGSPNWENRRLNVLREAYGLSGLTAEPIDVAVSVIGTKAITARKTLLQALLDSMPATVDAAATTNRAAVQSIITAMTTTFAEPTLTGSAIFPAAVAGITPVFDIDAARFDKVTYEHADRRCTVIQDTVGPYNFTGGTGGSGSAGGRWFPDQASGEKPYLYFDAIDFARYYQYTTAGAPLTTFDAANLAVTVFLVVEPEALGVTGFVTDVGSIGSATVEKMRLSQAAGQMRPSFRMGDGTGTTILNSGDTALETLGLGTRYACGWRVDASGVVTYFRGAVKTGVGTIANRTATTTTSIGVARRVASGFESFTYRGKLFRWFVATGAGSDADIQNALDGLRQKYSYAGKTCV